MLGLSMALVGIVTGVSNNFSTVISLLNTHLRISARLKKSNHFGSFYWEGQDYRVLTLDDIPQHVPVSYGDTVVTSGFSSIFPPDFPLGTIESFHSRGANFHSIKVKLFTDFKQLHQVWVLENFRANELDSLELADRTK
jgi:rod shape-determining protein MreC